MFNLVHINSTAVCGKGKMSFLQYIMSVFYGVAPTDTAIEYVRLSCGTNAAVTLWTKDNLNNRSHLSLPEEYSLTSPCSLNFNN